MPCPHNEITIVQRSQRQSAVAAAAYQSGEKLFCEYDQQVKHYPEKRGIVHNEILLPANAPRSYADRNTLWNAAEAVEKQLLDNYQPHESCPEVDGVTYRPEVYKIPKVRMFEI